MFLNIFTKVENINLLDQYISYAENSSRAFDLKEENGHWIIQNYTAFNCINCLAYMNVDFKKESLQAISKKSDYYNWLINCDTYDYTNFNLQWLIEVCPYHIEQKLKNVKTLKAIIEKELKNKFDSKLAQIYTDIFF